jgi:hypothetical protein
MQPCSNCADFYSSVYHPTFEEVGKWELSFPIIINNKFNDSQGQSQTEMASGSASLKR